MRSELSTEGKGGSNIYDPLALCSRQGACYLPGGCVDLGGSFWGRIPPSAAAGLSVTSALAEPSVDEKYECAYNIFNPAQTGQSTEPVQTHALDSPFDSL